MKSLWDRLIAVCRSLRQVPPCSLSDQVVEYALREYQIYHANFDALDAKASSVIQFVAIVLGLSTFSIGRARPFGPVQIAALGCFAAALALALWAWWVRGIEGIPAVQNICERLDDKGLLITRIELIGCLSESSDKARRTCLRKALLLKIALGFLLAGAILLIVSIGLRA